MDRSISECIRDKRYDSRVSHASVWLSEPDYSKTPGPDEIHSQTWTWTSHDETQARLPLRRCLNLKVCRSWYLHIDRYYSPKSRSLRLSCHSILWPSNWSHFIGKCAIDCSLDDCTFMINFDRPVNDVENRLERVKPCDLLEYREQHHFRAPQCLCPLLQKLGDREEIIIETAILEDRKSVV